MMLKHHQTDTFIQCNISLCASDGKICEYHIMNQRQLQTHFSVCMESETQTDNKTNQDIKI